MSDPKTKPKLVFVDNSSERLVMLHRKRTLAAPLPPNTPPPMESTAVGRGLCLVRAEYVEANAAKLGSLGLSTVDPLKIADMDVPRMLQRCTSRQAMLEWRKIEKRSRVIEQITARLENRNPDADEDAA